MTLRRPRIRPLGARRAAVLEKFFLTGLVLVVASLLWSHHFLLSHVVGDNGMAPETLLAQMQSGPLHPASQEGGFVFSDNSAFCRSMEGAISRGPGRRTMIHAFVSNSGHFPFLHNALLSMRRNGMKWKPAVFSIGTGLCPMLENTTALLGHVVCIPYLERMMFQLQRDEPESVEQIRDTLTKKYNSTQFDSVDTSFFGWVDGVEHKFLINAKLYVLRDILQCGPDAFITDTDIGFRRDPRPYFDIQGPSGDIVAQNDTNYKQYKLSLNTGFMYWRRTSGNLELIDIIIKVPPFWWIDQYRVNESMYNHSTPYTLLDRFKFPNGMIFTTFGDKLLDDLVALHANWNDKRHEKEGMLKKTGLWYLES